MTDTNLNDRLLISEGQHVLIKMPSENFRFVFMKPGDKCDLGKFGSFNVNALIGKEFNVDYEFLNQDELVRTDPVDADDALSENEVESAPNNVDLMDTNTSQKLSAEEIHEMKRKLANGDMNSKTMVSQLIENSESFDKRTTFSQSKYIRRKHRKFLRIVKVLKPTGRLLCESYFDKQPYKIRHLRVDSLSQILSMANVRSGLRALVLDDCNGLVIANLLERLGGVGEIIALTESETRTEFEMVRYLNLPKEHVDILKLLPSSLLEKPMEKEFIERTYPHPPKDEAEEKIRTEMRYQAKQRFIARIKQLNETRENVLAGQFDALIVASMYDPWSVIEQLSKYVSFSSPIVLYSAHKEPLSEAFLKCRNSTEFINVQLTESFLRRYQVLPGRFHPSMNTSGTGGYILSMIRVSNEMHYAPGYGPTATKATSNESSQ